MLVTSKPPKWITVTEAARRAGVPEATLRRWIKAGSWPVPVAELAGRKRVSLEALETWLASVQDD